METGSTETASSAKERATWGLASRLLAIRVNRGGALYQRCQPYL
jgi:hypothetical protein